MVQRLKTIDNLLYKLTSLQQLISNGLLIFMMLMISFDVIGRNFFNKPLAGTFEMTELSSALLVFFALAMTHRHGEHISIDFLVNKFPDKAKNILHGFIEFVIFTTLVIMANHVFANATRIMGRMTTTSDLGWPIYPFLYIATFTLGVFALVALASAIKYWLLAVDKS
ncbi:TRAP transporter small permease [Sporosarcina limicola]|uniref:TRAP-type C4-dicarboxylate transport system permease small subunit n=1 Tax=Sporosarcina limicola TaxID=34101 RepID=A0A927MIT2_9BACL|nr:TRAP transporter small permease [Sporosarcina limicola]MBE1555175.1 TRAP-type C4-dicarboxylate transport system permease small subunit [Sporosarcina limicola]